MVYSSHKVKRCFAYIVFLKDIETVKHRGFVAFQVPNLNSLLTMSSYRTVVFSSDYRWTMHIFVKSKTSHVRHRVAIRRTWGKQTVVGRWRTRTIFVVGTASGWLKESIRNESEIYGDILQVDAPDQYEYVNENITSNLSRESKNKIRLVV